MARGPGMRIGNRIFRAFIYQQYNTMLTKLAVLPINTVRMRKWKWNHCKTNMAQASHSTHYIYDINSDGGCSKSPLGSMQ